MVGTGKAAELGVLIRGGEALEAARRIDTIVLDKTGTITKGQPGITSVGPLVEIGDEKLLQLAASAEVGSEHPYGQAVVQAARARGISLLPNHDFRALAGKGVTAIVDGHRLAVGNAALVREAGIDDAPAQAQLAALAADGVTPLLVAQDDQLIGVLGVADTLKDSAREIVGTLQGLGLSTLLLTGDNRATAAAIARQAGIAEVLAEVLPAEKALHIQRLQEAGRVVAMVGDGINDAPALAQADLGIAMGAGADVAKAASDITLMGSDLRGIITAIMLSRRTVATIKQGLFWAFAYNIILIPVAMGILFPFFHVLLNPVLASAAMAMSSVSVVTNALRLRRFRLPERAALLRRLPWRDLLREYAYLGGIALASLTIGILALLYAAH